MDSSLISLVSLPALLLSGLLLALSTPTGPEAPPSPLPEGDVGIAAKYPADVGIETDPAVVFHDDFEDCRTVDDLSRRWDVVVHGANMHIVEDTAHVNGGRRSLELTIPVQREALSVEVGHYLPQTQDVLFLRFYMKLQEGFEVRRTSVHNGGAISSRYYPGGMATPGIRADGRNKLLANFETAAGGHRGEPPPGPLNIYLYHPEQRGDYGDDLFPTGLILPNTSLPGNFGPHFVPRPDSVPQLGRWYCYEYMVKMNTPGQRDGRIACWVDGKLIADFPNLRLRDIADLKLDRIGLCFYIADNRLRESVKWHDDVVAATSYIGPKVAGARP